MRFDQFYSLLSSPGFDRFEHWDIRIWDLFRPALARLIGFIAISFEFTDSVEINTNRNILGLGQGSRDLSAGGGFDFRIFS